MSQIFSLIRENCVKKEDQTIRASELEKTLLKRGYTKVDFWTCIENYVNLSVLYVDDNRNYITLL